MSSVLPGMISVLNQSQTAVSLVANLTAVVTDVLKLAIHISTRHTLRGGLDGSWNNFRDDWIHSVGHCQH